MLGLSVRQPWPALILRAGKDIENRRWPTRVRGWVLLHASRGLLDDEFEGADALITVRGLNWCGLNPDDNTDFPAGAMVGAIKITGCITESRSRWFVGPYGFVIEEARPFARPIRWRGMLGFFGVAPTPELAEQIAGLNLQRERWAA